MPFLEAIRQFALDIGKQNCLYIHLTLVPYLKAAGEAKTKPTQHSVEPAAADRHPARHPHLPDRTAELAKDEAEKIALFCNVEPRAVIEERDKEFSIYEVPVSLVENRLDELIVEKLSLRAKPLEIGEWRQMLQQHQNPAHEVTHRRRRQVHQAQRRLQVDLRIAGSCRHRPCRPACWFARSKRRKSNARGPTRC